MKLKAAFLTSTEMSVFMPMKIKYTFLSEKSHRFMYAVEMVFCSD